MNNSGKSKSQIMKSLMGHPETSKMFRDAINSPLGSTNRTKAQKIFKIMSKLQGSYDGAGGPGMAMDPRQNQSISPIPKTPEITQGMVIFRKLPPLKINFGGKVQDGSGGPGDTNWFSSSLNSLSSGLGSVGGNPNVFNTNTPPKTDYGLNLKLPSSNQPTNTGLTQNGQPITATPSYEQPIFPVPPKPPTIPSTPTVTQDNPPAFVGPIKPPTKVTPDVTPQSYGTAQFGPNKEYTYNVDQNGNAFGAPINPPSGIQKFTGGLAPYSPDVKSAVKAGEGPLDFAYDTMKDPNDPTTKGLSMTEEMAQNRTTLWDKYNIGGLQEQEVNLRDASRKLPEEVTAYIRGRDQYLNQTNDMITDFINKTANTTGGDPGKIAANKEHLNYLYTLRGMQTKSYIEYFNTAIQKNTDELAHVTDMYSTALNAYTTDLTSANAITEDKYKTYSAVLADMYTNIEQAPLKKLQTDLLKEQILIAQAQRVSDGIKALNQGDYLKDSTALNGHITDSEGYLMPGIDLAKTINDFSVLQPGMSPTSLIQKYTEGVNNILSARPGAETKEKQLMDGAFKLTVGKEAMKQFANIANMGLQSSNLNTYNLGYNAAQDVASRIGHSVGGTLSQGDTGTKLIEVVKSLSSSPGLFNWSKPPSKEQFFANFTSKTSGSLDESMANAIAAAMYANFETYTTPGTQEGVAYEGGSPASYVSSILNDLTSTTGRSNPVPLTPNEVANRIGFIYAQQLLVDSLGTPPA